MNPDTEHATFQRGIRHMATSILLVLALAFTVHRAIYLMHARDMPHIIQAAEGITSGHPHWRVYQSRILGPFAVLLLAGCSDVTYTESYHMTVLLLTVLIHLIPFLLFRSLVGNTARAFRYTAVLSLGFLLTQDRVYLFLWDYLDVLMFSALAYGAIRHKSVLYFTAIFAVAVLNKESALFIPLWLLMDGVYPGEPKSRPECRDIPHPWIRAVTGLCLFAIGWVLIEWIRRSLFLDSTGFLVHDGPGTGLGQHLHFKLFRNAVFLWEHIRQPDFSLHWIASILWILLVPAYVVRFWKQMDSQSRKLALLLMAVYTSILLLGGVLETRVFLGLIPLILFLDTRTARRNTG